MTPLPALYKDEPAIVVDIDPFPQYDMVWILYRFDGRIRIETVVADHVEILSTPMPGIRANEMFAALEAIIAREAAPPDSGADDDPRRRSS